MFAVCPKSRCSHAALSPAALLGIVAVQQEAAMRRTFIATLLVTAFGLAGPLHAADGVGLKAAGAGADEAAILVLLNMPADANGRITNECGEAVMPRFQAAELGGDVGTAILLSIEGGPNSAACYGDGPDLHLMKREGNAFREIYSARGRMLVILPTETNGVHDIADGGPGFSYPLWTWNGSEYANANSAVSDADLGSATFLP